MKSVSWIEQLKFECVTCRSSPDALVHLKHTGKCPFPLKSNEADPGFPSKSVEGYEYDQPVSKILSHGALVYSVKSLL